MAAIFSLSIYLAACIAPAMKGENGQNTTGWQLLVIAFGKDQGLLSLTWWWLCNPIHLLAIGFAMLGKSRIVTRLGLCSSGISVGFTLVFFVTFAISGEFPLMSGTYLWSTSMIVLYATEARFGQLERHRTKPCTEASDGAFFTLETSLADAR